MDLLKHHKNYHNDPLTISLPESLEFGYSRVSDEILFDAILRPNQSLGNKGLLLVMGFATLLCLGGGALFVLAGAWPVTGFLGIDLALLFFALRVSHRSGLLTEKIQLRPATLTVSRCSASGHQMAWSFQPHWLKVEYNHEKEQDSQVILSSKGERLNIASFLSPKERAEFVNALRTELQRCKNMTTPSKY